jgi:hypothetical protein
MRAGTAGWAARLHDAVVQVGIADSIYEMSVAIDFPLSEKLQLEMIIYKINLVYMPDLVLCTQIIYATFQWKISVIVTGGHLKSHADRPYPALPSRKKTKEKRMDKERRTVGNFI